MTSRTLLRTIVVCVSASALFACNRHHDQDASKAQAESASPEVPKVVLEAKPPPDAVSLPSAADLAPVNPPVDQTATPPSPPVDPVITDAEQRASAVDARLAELSKHEGQWSLGEAHSRYTAYSQDKDLDVIDEQLDMADAGSSSNKYYFNNGNLYLYEESGQWREINPPNPIVNRHIQRTMVFDASGKLVTASKLVDGKAAPVQGYEANAVLARALDLRNAAMAPPPPAKAAPAATEKSVKQAVPAEKSTALKETARKQEKKAEPASGVEAHAAGDNNLRLEAGKTPAVVKGTVAAKQVREYFVQAKSGQLMTVNLQSPNQAATFAVYSSHGEIVSGLTDWSAKLPRDGDYRIRIVTSRSGGPSEYSMRVTLQ